MAERFLSARVPEELKRQVKTLATQKDQSVQDFVGEIVLAYINNANHSSRVEALNPTQKNVINVWADALLNREEAAQYIFKIMEMWCEKWKNDGYGNQP